MSTTDDGTGGARGVESVGNGTLVDTWIVAKRWLVKTTRSPMVTITSLVQPIVFFVLFVEVFGAVAEDAVTASVGPEVHYVTFLVPAIVVQSALAAAGVSGIGLVIDMDTGMFEKVLVSPIDRTAMFVGKVLSSVVRIVVQTLLILVLGYAVLYAKTGDSFGAYLDTGLLGVLGIVVITVAFAFVFMAFSNVVALLTRDEEATILLSNVLTFPLLFVSPAFVPLEVLPNWIQTVAKLNPITYGVEGIRAIVLGEDVLTAIEVSAFSGIWNTVVPSVAVLLAFTAVLGAVALRLLDQAASADVQ